MKLLVGFLVFAGIFAVYDAFRYVPKTNVKKIFFGTLIAVFILAIGLPRITSDGLNSLSSLEEKKELERLEEKVRLSFRLQDQLMVQSYEVKPYGHKWNSLKKRSDKNYRITYYTFFGLPYAGAEVSKAGGELDVPNFPYSLSKVYWENWR